jgi:acyl-CoA thioesterase-1
VAAEQGLAFVGAGDWLTRYGLEVHLADAVHMNDEGHRALGELLLERLSSLGLER